MAPLSATHVTPHFSRWEMRYDETPAHLRPNLEALASLLEGVRSAVGGVPLAVKRRTYRTPDHNAELPGASTSSQHLTASAGDFTPVGITVEEFLRRLDASGFALGHSQVIVYPLGTDHVHIGLPLVNKPADTVLIQTSFNAASPVYEPVALADSASRYAAWRTKRPGVAPLLVLVALVVVALVLTNT